MWYSKYLLAFECDPNEINESVINDISTKLAKFHQPIEPICSIVVIAHNEERRILGCLWSLAENILDVPAEIIVVNNNSTDKTTYLLDRVGACWYDEKQKGPGFARQCGLNKARGKYHLCIDSDTLYPPYYVATHLKYLSMPNVVCTYGLWSFMPDEKHSRIGLFCYESFRDIYLRLQNIKRPELCVRGMVMGFNTDLGKQIGYRTDIIRGEDGSLALALKQFGKLKFLTTNKTRAVTCSTTLDGGGGLLSNMWIRFKKAVRQLGGLFISKREYKDENSNIIKP
ncbi:MAG: glycosyltransferase family 2 protein [Mediterranea massiliensis]|nr:glycosyltransferase family 2 protein [Mediterranea massiliensis]